jgi:hypothetical protein
MSANRVIKKVQFPHKIIGEILDHVDVNLNRYDFNRLNIFDSNDKIEEVLEHYKLILQSMKQVKKNILNILLDHILILLKFDLIPEDTVNPKHMNIIRTKYKKINILNETIQTKTIINYFYIQYFHTLIMKFIEELTLLKKYLNTIKCYINDQISISKKITIIDNAIPDINKYIQKLDNRLSDINTILNAIN